MRSLLLQSEPRRLPPLSQASLHGASDFLVRAARLSRQALNEVRRVRELRELPEAVRCGRQPHPQPFRLALRKCRYADIDPGH